MASTSRKSPVRGSRAASPRPTSSAISTGAGPAPPGPCCAEVDMTPLMRLRDQWKQAKETGGRAPSFLVAVCRATVQALAEFPRMNAVVQDETTILRKDINLGVAVDTDKGLLVPVIRKANEKSVLGLARALEDLAARARTGKVTADELSGGSFTVSNPGLKGNLWGASIINQPQVGIVRMGEIVKRAGHWQSVSREVRAGRCPGRIAIDQRLHGQRAHRSAGAPDPHLLCLAGRDHRGAVVEVRAPTGRLGGFHLRAQHLEELLGAARVDYPAPLRPSPASRSHRKMDVLELADRVRVDRARQFAAVLAGEAEQVGGEVKPPRR